MSGIITIRKNLSVPGIDVISGSVNITKADTSLIPYEHGFIWNDDDSDGVGNGWTKISGAGSTRIITGGGFDGNAQYIGHVINTETKFAYYTGVTSVNGATYRVKLKYKNNTSQFRLNLRNTSDRFVIIPYSANVVEVEYNKTASGESEIILCFQILAGYSSCGIWIDEIQLYKIT